jgi:hypothetical protein
MSDEREQSGLEAKADEPLDASYDPDDDDVASPFDHPAFLPVLLVALSCWFGFDGWFSETIESVRFNRYGFFFLVGFAAYFATSEVVKIRFLLPMLWGVFSLWLLVFTLVGSDDAWWRSDPGAMLFNQIGAGVCAVCAVFFLIREARAAD